MPDMCRNQIITLVIYTCTCDIKISIGFHWLPIFYILKHIIGEHFIYE